MDDLTYDIVKFLAAEAEAESHYPKCDRCGERILDEICYSEDGVRYLCRDCAEEEFLNIHRVKTPYFD